MDLVADSDAESCQVRLTSASNCSCRARTHGE
jgi:hypothetical protein